MPGHYPRKYYAVRIGRDGPQILDSYVKFIRATSGLSGWSGKGFDTIEEAQQWLNAGLYPLGAVASLRSSTNVNVTINITTSVDNEPRSEASVSSTATVTTSLTRAPSVLPWQQTLPGNDPPIRGTPYSQRSAQLLGENPASAQTDVPPPVPPEPEIVLSEEQKKVLDLVRERKNVFFTGAAGTGKSVLLKEVINVLKVMYGPERVAITAPTGVAGLNIGGRTIYSWAGIRLGKEPAEVLVDGLSLYKKKQWSFTGALIIDEISMLDGRLLDKLDYIGRTVRKDPHPFGGIQLILSGDFFQLPPVGEKDSTTSIPPLFAFQANCWSKCIDEMVELSKVYRQKDNKFIDMLSAVREGRLENWHREEFRRLSRPRNYDDGIEPTQLFPLKASVERCNQEKLQKLPGEARLFKAMDSYGYDIYDIPIDPRMGEQLLQRLVVAKEITLKIGAQVMLLRNQNQGNLVNGSLGKVMEFITVHEAQKRHLEIAEMCKGESPGTSKPLMLADPCHIFSKQDTFPLVQFTNGNVLLCAPTDFTVENIKGGVEARRIQIPLALSYAMSIHKSQGQTLSRVKVDLGYIFEKGQAYVALSRATSMEGLEILGFDPAGVAAHPKVLQWQEGLQGRHQKWDSPVDATKVEAMDDSLDWTMIEGVDTHMDHSIDEEMDQDFVVGQYFSSILE